MFNVAYKFVAKHDEAEDLTQDIFLKIFKSLDTFDRRANFQTWLISVSRNLCIDHYRSVRKERETIDRDVDPGDLSPVSHEVSPYAALEQRDRVSLLREAMAALPDTLRTAVLLRDIRELSYQEIADTLAAAGRHREVAHQPWPDGTGPPDQAPERPNTKRPRGPGARRADPAGRTATAAE